MEKKYDVFISFKNSDDNGNKTKDSIIAKKLYNYLTDKGLRVFFSETELEFLGMAQYTPVIDDSLDSSRFLIAVGCSHDNLNARWVRYEWESFLNDIRSGIKKDAEVFVLYQDMTTKEMPRALRQQQAFDANDENSYSKLYNFIINATERINDSTNIPENSTNKNVQLYTRTETAKNIDTELSAYIEQASKLRNNMIFFGIEYSLSNLYVDVNIYKKVIIKDGNKDKIVNIPQTPSSILELQTPVLIIGQAGSGKTSLLNSLFLISVKNEEAINTIPVFMSLSEFERSYKSGLSMKQFIAQLPEFREINIDNFFTSDKRWIFFLDGLDEVMNRSPLLTEIERFVSKCQNAHIIFSSRPIDENVIYNGIPLNNYYIEKFSEDQQKTLLKNIATTVYPDIDLELLNKKISDFQTSDKNISEILTNPLYLSMMVMVYKNEVRINGKDTEVIINKLELFERSSKLIINTDSLKHENELAKELIPIVDIILGRVALTLYDAPNASAYQLKPDVESFIAFKLSCSDEDASSLAELFFNFAEKRSIFANGKFFHESFREYFAALYLYRTLYVSKNTPFGKKILLTDKDSLVSIINLLIKNENSQNVLENLLCFVDFNSRNDESVIRPTFELVLEVLINTGLPLNLLENSTERFLYHRELGRNMLLSKMLDRSCNFLRSPFSELYYYISKYDLVSSFDKVYDLIKIQYRDDVKNLLIAEICYSLYEYVYLKNETIYDKLLGAFTKIDISTVLAILRKWLLDEEYTIYYLVSILNEETSLWNGYVPDLILYSEGNDLESVLGCAEELCKYYFELAKKYNSEIPTPSSFEKIRNKWKRYEISAIVINSNDECLFLCSHTLLKSIYKLLKEVNSTFHLTESNSIASPLEKANILSFLGDYEGAIATISEGIASGDSNLAVLYDRRGKIYENLEKHENAIYDYTEAINIDPDSINRYQKRIEIYKTLKEYDKAILDYNEIIRLDPKSAYRYGNRAKIYEILQKYEEAIADYTEVINLEPDNATAYNNRGNCYNKLKKHEKAIADYTEAIRIKPDYAAAYNNRGYCYNNLQEYEKAIADYTEVIRIKPDNATAYKNRGCCYDNLKEYEKAIADYTEVIRIEPDNATAYNNRGYYYDTLKEYEKAIADYTEAIRIKPDYANPYNNRGKTFENIKKYEKALNDYTEAIKFNPQYAKAYYNRGLVYEEMKDFEKALSDYKEAIGINPDYFDANNRFAELCEKIGKSN